MSAKKPSKAAVLLPPHARAALCAVLAAAALAPAVAAAKEPATVRLWNWNVHDKKYQQKMYKLFNQRHPEIKLEYSSISNTVYDQTLEAAFIAKEPPDLFLPSGKLTFTHLRDKGMIMPLKDVAPNANELSSWMAQFPAQLRKFVEGRSMFEGKVYIVDTSGEGFGGVTLYYNKTLFGDAGLAQPPATQSQLRQYAAKVTKAGQGKSFGIVDGLRYRPGAWHQDMASSTKNPEAVWEVIEFISSLEYQEGYVQGGYGLSYLPAANRRENFQVPQMYRFVEWYMDPNFTRIMPSPKNQGALVVYDYFPGIYPTYEDVMDNVYLGKSGFDALVDLDRRCDAALDVAIAKAQEAGVKVTREDLYFPDWDPSKDYIPKKQ